MGLKAPFDVVGNGIENRSDGNAERFRSRFGISGPIVLFIGRKDADKGCPMVLEAFRKIHAQRPDVSLVCMGPPGAVALEQGQAGLLDLDFADEDLKHDALAACTCLCVPSEGESFGLVYMEAGRYAKPVIARKLPVLEELLGTGKAGLLLGLPNRSTNSCELEVKELRDGILHLLSDPTECRRLGKACRQVSDEFVWPRIVQRFEEAYSEVLEQTTAQRSAAGWVRVCAGEEDHL
jgi:glycosyltransferase involved in cell wall biosynthesis